MSNKYKRPEDVPNEVLATRLDHNGLQDAIDFLKANRYRKGFETAATMLYGLLSARERLRTAEAEVERLRGAEPVAWMRNDGNVVDAAYKMGNPHEDGMREFSIPLYRAPAPDAVVEAKAPKWQPMETAPRDGTPFLAYIEFENRGKPDWEINIVALDPEYIEPVMDADYEDGWEFEHYDAWMPLPTPPMKEGE